MRLFWSTPKTDYCALTHETGQNSGGNMQEFKVTAACEVGVKMPKRCLCFLNACLFVSEWWLNPATVGFLKGWSRSYCRYKVALHALNAPLILHIIVSLRVFWSITAYVIIVVLSPVWHQRMLHVIWSTVQSNPFSKQVTVCCWSEDKTSLKMDKLCSWW